MMDAQLRQDFEWQKKLAQQKHEGVMPCKNRRTFSMDHKFTLPNFSYFSSINISWS